jgi:3',5'-cyclic-AMP phosphodiesterase
MTQLIHISDTHIGPAREFEVRGAQSLARLEALVDAINGLDFTPDLVIHTGDVTNDPEPAAYQLAAESLGRLRVPVYFATGNHDEARMMRTYLPDFPRTPLVDDADRLAYRIDLPNLRLFALDGKVPESEGPHGRLPDNQLDALRRELSAWPGEFAVFLHFPPLPIGSPWIDEHLLLLNGGELHRLLVAAGIGRNRGVFFGHLHRGLQICRDGILYSAVSSPACQFSVGLNDAEVAFDSRCPLALNHLTLLPGTTMVKELTPMLST